ncbi:MAG: thermonuclease family protein [Leptolyngbyaceae cyanobacterium SM1_1_3]|nr:thermonuclease family protein [Leptolyngbyaceae cyanobacterium SM1_1_3]NJM85289.1 thermonuclease family protein [Leptolyngbyaceae cyanobacterium RM2_2_21]NJN01489.1 thermonuclease family protein [Leptolyngbyaceae cyanobacterium RM1_1_2]NJO08698.1 thermonuclease family protein [Leptolyngbyaceae cyanobacterium SL_1_1]
MLRSHFWSFFLICLLSACLWGCQETTAQMESYQVEVERALSGQVIALSTPVGADPGIYQIRLAGIQAPDLAQAPWGKAAQQRLQELVELGSVRLELVSAEPDDYDRLWAYVWRDRQLINQQLANEGYVLVDQSSLASSPYQQQLIRAQERARLVGLGIWQPEQPMRLTPAEFRQQQAQS